MRLAFERVFQPFLLAHVNRYAGIEYGQGRCNMSASDRQVCHLGCLHSTSSNCHCSILVDDVKRRTFVPTNAKLVIKGFRSQWRSAPAVVRRCIVSVLQALLVQNDKRAAIAQAKVRFARWVNPACWLLMPSCSMISTGYCRDDASCRNSS